jgi:hypothetical protein
LRDGIGADLVEAPLQGPQVLRIELRREARGFHKVVGKGRYLPTLSRAALHLWKGILLGHRRAFR